MNELLDITALLDSDPEYPDDFFPDTSGILIDPDPGNPTLLQSFLNQRGLGEGGVIYTKQGHFIFFDNPECCDNYKQYDNICQNRFTIYENTLYGVFEENMVVHDLDALHNLHNSARAIVETYKILKYPDKFNDFVSWAEKKFESGEKAFLSLEEYQYKIDTDDPIRKIVTSSEFLNSKEKLREIINTVTKTWKSCNPIKYPLSIHTIYSKINNNILKLDIWDNRGCRIYRLELPEFKEQYEERIEIISEKEVN